MEKMRNLERCISSVLYTYIYTYIHIYIYIYIHVYIFRIAKGWVKKLFNKVWTSIFPVFEGAPFSAAAAYFFSMS
jgi:hypothetical protein